MIDERPNLTHLLSLPFGDSFRCDKGAMTLDELRALLADALIYVRCDACDGEATARGCVVCRDLGMVPSRKPVMAAIFTLIDRADR